MTGTKGFNDLNILEFARGGFQQICFKIFSNRVFRIYSHSGVKAHCRVMWTRKLPHSDGLVTLMDDKAIKIPDHFFIPCSLLKKTEDETEGEGERETDAGSILSQILHFHNISKTLFKCNKYKNGVLNFRGPSPFFLNL